MFDLDGVLRHFDRAHVAAIEQEHGLTPGSIHAAAFAEPGLTEVTTGVITREEWMLRVGALLDSPSAAAEWAAHPSTADDRMLTLSDQLRAIGIRTAILTNGTDTIAAELRELGIDKRVDAVFNPAEIGFAKPDARVFQHVLDSLAREPQEVFFTDDSANKLVGAAELGMLTHHFTDITALRAALSEAGLPLPHGA